MTRLRLVLATAATVVLGVTTAATPAAAVARADTTVDPTVVSFGVLAPGVGAARDVVLTTDEPSDGEVVRLTVQGGGALVAHLTTGLRACGTAWTNGACPGGATTLVDAWRSGDAAATSTSVPVGARDTLHLRVEVAVDADAPQGASAALTYTLRLQGSGALPPSPPTPPLAQTGSDVLAGAAAAVALVLLGSALVGRARRGRST